MKKIQYDNVVDTWIANVDLSAEEKPSSKNLHGQKMQRRPGSVRGVCLFGGQHINKWGC